MGKRAKLYEGMAGDRFHVAIYDDRIQTGPDAFKLGLSGYTVEITQISDEPHAVGRTLKFDYDDVPFFIAASNFLAGFKLPE